MAVVFSVVVIILLIVILFKLIKKPIRLIFKIGRAHV